MSKKKVEKELKERGNTIIVDEIITQEKDLKEKVFTNIKKLSGNYAKGE